VEKEKGTAKEFVLLTSREIGIIAAFSGLLFASVALGLMIPILPNVAIFALEPLALFGGFATGPIGAFLITGIMGTPRPLAVENWLVYGTGAAIVSAAYWPIRNWSLSKKIPMMVLFAAFQYYGIGFLPAMAYEVYVMKFVPPEAFWEYTYMNFLFFSTPEVIYHAIALPVLMRAFPNFVRPTWWSRWRGTRST
jgi:hypothetical protein